MSGFSDKTTCPNCGADADLYVDYKPFEHSSIQCDECGLIISPEISYMDLEELNERRASGDLEPLDKLPEQKEDIW